jgi:hypothetical protein
MPILIANQSSAMPPSQYMQHPSASRQPSILPLIENQVLGHRSFNLHGSRKKAASMTQYFARTGQRSTFFFASIDPAKGKHATHCS